MATFRKFWLILWKNWLFRKRQYLLTLLEVILPTLFSILLLYLRNSGDRQLETVYHSEFTEFYPIPLISDNVTNLIYSPDSNLSRSLLQNVIDSPEANISSARPMANDDAMDDIVLNKNSDDVLFGVSFVGLGDKLPMKLHYRIRGKLGNSTVWGTDIISDPSPKPAEKAMAVPYVFGFLWLQNAIAMRFIELSAKQKNLSERNIIGVQRLPYPPYLEDTKFSAFLQAQLPFFIVLSYIFVSPTLIKQIVHEKELGVRELMKLMGLPGWLQWSGWFVSAFIVMSISSLIIVILLSLNWFGLLAVLPNTSLFLFFLLLLLYVASSIFFCFLISTFTSKPTIATAIGVIAWLLTYYVPIALLDKRYTGMSAIEKMAIMLLPNMAITYAVRLILSFEARHLSLGLANLFDPSYPGDNLTLAHIIVMFIVDILVYSFLTWYFDNVLPSAFGVRKPWFFLFTKKYWCPGKTGIEPIPNQKTPPSTTDFEPDPPLPPVIKIQNLTKKFGWRETGKTAVNNISLTMYEGQITALLGHNGAGKTTTMSMLTGMFPPTSGDAFVNNHSIRTDIELAREDLGLCPQHNMLFSNLTVTEHLKFFGKLKIKNNAVLKNEVKELLHRLKLLPNRNTLAKKLSGGTMRKLSLGIALIGGPKVVMLDEPTSGMDPEARRSIWDLLQEYRVGRCIILTTHFMEEADVLGDRIAIMANGKIVCCGSPIFLKNRYGAGYHLIISKGRLCNVPRITELLKDRIKGSYMSTNTANEVSFVLPMDQTNNFPEAFKQLEDNMRDLGINNFGISVTTMEEVFLKVGELPEAAGGAAPVGAAPVVSQNIAVVTQKYTGCMLWCVQFWGMILKRWYYARRRWILLIAQILIPSVMSLIVLQLLKAITAPSLQESPLVMDISHYTHRTVVVTMPKQFETWYTASFPEDTEFIKVPDAAMHIKNIPKSDYPTYVENYVVGAAVVFDNATQTFQAIIWYSGQYLHAQPLSLNLYHNALLKYSTQNMNYAIKVENKPFPMNKDTAARKRYVLTIVHTLLIGIFVPVGLSFLSSSFVVFPIHERATKCKHLQLMTGCNGLIFWGASFLWDFVTHIICSCIIVVVFIFMDSMKTFTGKDRTEILFLILLLYGWCSIPFSYLASFLTSQPATGFTRLTVLNLIAGVILSIVVFVLLYLTPGTLVDILLWFSRFLPNFTVAFSLMRMGDISGQKESCAILNCRVKQPHYLQWKSPGIGQDMFMMFFTGLLYSLIIFLIEQGVLYRIWYVAKRISHGRLRGGEDTPGKLDADVVAEKERVYKILKDKLEGRHVLVVNDLTKKFGNTLAVDGLNFALGCAECFGLLGIEGAGKTTTFEMLAGSIFVTNGTAYAIGKNLTKNRHSYLSKIGYCPQFDALIDHLTGSEMLRVFAHLRGIPRSKIGEIVKDYVAQFDLQEHAHKITRVYSGGNKRKLSAALAFIGDPPIVFLDEPTTGVDPVAKRKIWDILINANSVGISIVLTSHSMEECEILCSRIAILVSGQFRCIGGTQYLKNKFSQGFIILAKIKRLKDGDEEMARRQQSFQKFVQAQFPSAVLKDVHHGLVQYQVIDPKTKWTYLFETMEKAKLRFTLEDYSVSQATMEQVFLSFAKRQETS